MVNFEDKRFKNMPLQKKRKLIDSLIKKADQKLEDVDIFIDMLNTYKANLQSKRP